MTDQHLGRLIDLRLDIELGLCSGPCAGAITESRVCQCTCAGKNHGALWSPLADIAGTAMAA